MKFWGWVSKIRSVPYVYFFLLILLAGCGHKEEAQKDEGHKDAEHKGKKEEVERSIAIVAHLRLDLDHELREQTTPLALPEKPDEISPPKPVGKEKALPGAQLPDEDTRYKTDKEYLALRQFVQPVRDEGIKAPVKEKGGKEEAGTIQARDRGLVLGGKGFGLQGTDSKENVSIDTTRYLEDVSPPAPPKKEPETLDLREGEVRNKRSLIFNQQGGGFFKVEEPEKVKATAIKAPKIAPPPGEKIPETQILLSQSKGKELVLLPKDREIDLLMGNEDVNRKVFGSR